MLDVLYLPFRQKRDWSDGDDDIHRTVIKLGTDFELLHPLREAVNFEPEDRASAAQMLLKLYNGEGLSTPRDPIPELKPFVGGFVCKHEAIKMKKRRPAELEEPAVMKKPRTNQHPRGFAEGNARPMPRMIPSGRQPISNPPRPRPAQPPNSRLHVIPEVRMNHVNELGPIYTPPTVNRAQGGRRPSQRLPMAPPPVDFNVLRQHWDRPKPTTVVPETQPEDHNDDSLPATPKMPGSFRDTADILRSYKRDAGLG